MTLALVAAGCGNSGSDANVPVGFPNGPELTKSAINIGVVSEQSGPTASAFKFPPKVAEIWAEWVNSQGGINGHPVKVFEGDGKGDPATGQAEVKRLVETDNVLALVGIASTSESAWAPYVEQQRVPVVGGQGVASAWMTSPVFFQTAAIGFQYNKLNALAVDSVDAKSMSLAVCAEVASCSSAEGLAKPEAARLGIRYDGTVKISQTAPNYTAQCLEFKAAGTEAVYSLVASSAAIRLFEDCRRQNFEPYLGVNAGGLTSGLADAGINLVGVDPSFPWWVDDAPVQQYRDVMKQGGASEADYSASTATSTWAALELFKTAMANASDSPTREEVFKALYDLKPTNLNGLIAQTVDYSDSAPTQPSFDCAYLVRLNDGKWSADGLKSSCSTN